MALAIVYGGYQFFFASSAGNGIENPEKKGMVLNEFVTDVAAKLTKKDISKTDKYIIGRAKDPWGMDPFLKDESMLKAEAVQEQVEASVPQVNFFYSGYMQMDNKQLAIINGMEYSIGEVLEPGGYTVLSISPTQVVLRVEGTDQTMTLYSEETNQFR